MLTTGLPESGLCQKHEDPNNDGDLCEQPPAKLTIRMATQDSSYFDSVISSFAGQVNPIETVNYSGKYSPSGTHSAENSVSDNDAKSHPSVCVNGVLPNAFPVEKMSRTNLYIKGLPDSFNDDKLWNLPPQSDQIKSVKAATDDDGKCRGYGFIDFISQEAANEALQHIRDTYPAFTIKFAKENEKDKTNLYVTNLPKSWTTKDSDQLKMVFERFGPIQSAFVMMERSTNRTTGVGFVRFANERDALAALDYIKSNPIILPECNNPVEAKFADKHNPDTRRRRYPMSTLLNNSAVNSLIGYPLTLGHGAPLSSQDAISSLLNGALTMHPNSNNQSSLASLQILQNKSDYAHGFAQSLLSNSISAKLPSTVNSSTPLGVSDFAINPGTNANAESNLNALAAAAATALIGAGASPGFVNNCLRPPHGCGPGPLPATINANLISTNHLSILGTSPTDTTLLDPNNLYRCGLYNTDFYRQSQQQQILAAAMQALNGTPTAGAIYPSIPDLSPYLAYQAVLTPHQATALSGVTSNPCLAANGSGLGQIYANHNNGLINTNPLLNSTAPLPTDPIHLVTTRPNNMLHQWALSNQLIKPVANESITATQTAVLPNQGS
ncbi:RNA-binding motif, single-stranded-interacting protein 2 [Clonorchis sinensis]|uniref:RNA-binding motif, single-stranded-interacting protein 2 n=1 Tax=Clonorchis sinensis TaxID=79923 RepID=A0A8T1M771_CLOSI|nr:RNA-binding motif, single-stranded-interacting protein 2 [Clonorchis sinensis]